MELKEFAETVRNLKEDFDVIVNFRDSPLIPIEYVYSLIEVSEK